MGRLIRMVLDFFRPHFEGDGKLSKMYPVFEAGESFFFVSPTRTDKGAHIRDALDTKRLMSMVIVALIPPLLWGIYNVGRGYYLAQGGPPALADAGILGCVLIGLRYVLPIIIVSYTAGGIVEVIFAVVRKHEINEGFLVTGLLVPLIVPPTIPLWVLAVSTAGGVLLGKEAFGGTGMNPFNPALICRAIIFLGYPRVISGEVWRLLPEQTIQGYSGATPLAYAAGPEVVGNVHQSLAAFGGSGAGQFADYSWSSMFLGTIPGCIGETSTLMCLIGAVILLAVGVASWRIMVSGLVGAVVTSVVMNLLAPSPASIMALAPQYHLVMGGFAFGLVFMATDPVSGAATNTGKWIYGFCIGMLCIIIRCINPGWPEGMMFAILLMNVFAPTIDYFVVQRNIKRRQARAQAVQ